MNERLPSVCLVRFCVDGLFVTYHVTVPFAFAALPVIVSHTRVVPATRCPQPPLAPAAGQSVPPTIPPRKRSNGRMNDCVSLPQPPFLLVHVAPLAVQLEMQRERPPLLLPCQKRRLVPVPTGSMREEKPAPPRPICHCTGPVGLPLNVAELGPLSCAPPLACGLAAVSKLPLMSPE